MFLYYNNSHYYNNRYHTNNSHYYHYHYHDNYKHSYHHNNYYFDNVYNNHAFK